LRAGDDAVFEDEEIVLTGRKILLGNEAIACGLLESACTMATSYPGTPASEILGTLVEMKSEIPREVHLEWSINEKVAFEVALANSFTGRRSVTIMKQVGLNVAADPLMSAAYTGVTGGFVVISADDPGPQSSQTEQDSRFMAMLAKIPVLDPSSPLEARKMAKEAFLLSEKYEIPVMLRPTIRVCHGRQDMEVEGFPFPKDQAAFQKNPGRWAATPEFRFMLHGLLNKKLEEISEDMHHRPGMINAELMADHFPQTLTGENEVCIVTSGVVAAHVQEIMADLQLLDKVPLYQVSMPFPLSSAFRDELLGRYDRILVLEETYPVMELQFRNGEKVFGRHTGTVPPSGELLPEILGDILTDFLHLDAPSKRAPSVLPVRRPTLCAGCPHRSAFYAIRKVFPEGIYPGDMGCYTLGLNLGAVDTVLCMGASISQASGFYHAFKSQKTDAPSICAAVGDSTFFHAGIPALINAVVQGARFVLVILDNRTTAITGHQPTPTFGKTLDGMEVSKVSIPDLVRACGVQFVETEDPYALESFMKSLKRAHDHTLGARGGVAVVIAQRPCLMDRLHADSWNRMEIQVTEECTGCHLCVTTFECPAIVPQGEQGPVRIDQALCSGCGVCLDICPHGGFETI